MKNKNKLIDECQAKLLEKAEQLGHGSVSKEDIAIERSAEMLDEIQRTSEREVALILLTQNWETSSEVRDALQRLKDGSFGTCQRCEEPIGERRLNAIPWAKYCILCQTAADRENQLDRAA